MECDNIDLENDWIVLESNGKKATNFALSSYLDLNLKNAEEENCAN